jgi:hypothetical protein
MVAAANKSLRYAHPMEKCLEKWAAQTAVSVSEVILRQSEQFLKQTRPVIVFAPTRLEFQTGGSWKSRRPH